MKALFLSLFVILSIAARASIYYVDQEGSNSNDGSKEQPWATIMYAANQATSRDDTIFINAGNHDLSSSVNIAVGVSLLGEGNTSVVNVISTGDWDFGIYLTSGQANTNGEQRISHLKFTGNSFNASGGIVVRARGNVEIHDCEFEDFDDNAVTFHGQAEFGGSPPTVWTIGNRFYNNIVSNCCKRQEGDWMSGALQIGSQEGMHIYNNQFTENERGEAQCGYPIKYYANGFLRDLKIYDNTIIKLPAVEDSNDWNFAIELWNWMGGIEIYNNHIEGSIDVDHVIKGDYSFGTRIHDNYFGYPTLPTSSGNWTNLNAGIYIEFACNDVHIYSNEFHNLESPIRFSPRDETLGEINISYNLIHQIGNANGDDGCNLMNFSGNGFTLNNLNFLNNTIYAGSNGAAYGLIISGDNFKKVVVRNNIFHGFEVSPIEVDGGNTDSLFIENNAFYENGYNFPNVFVQPRYYSNTSNLSVDPDFMNPGTDFSLKDTSPYIDKGIDVGLTTDYVGNPILGLPDIGAFEFGTTSTMGLPPPDMENTFIAYLNTANDCVVSVEAPGIEYYRIRVYDMLGRNYYRSKQFSGQSKIIIPESELNPGLNIIAISYGNNLNLCQKIVFN